eukprot:m.159644 g.159644  ORF g.159644 m.159644 type:complete len:343 (+) comp31143_c0_seq2:221-1249(+)
MKEVVFNNIERRISRWFYGRGTCDSPGNERGTSLFDLLKEISIKNGLPYEVARSVYAQKMKDISKTEYAGTRDVDWYPEYVHYTQMNRSMVELACDRRVSPWQIAQRVVASVVDTSKLPELQNSTRKKASKISPKIKAIINQFYLAEPNEAVLPLLAEKGQYINVMVLHRDVVACARADTTQGPLVERIKHNIGLEYEYILQEQLARHNIGYLSEDMLRSQQSARTPDCVLLTPIEVCGHLCYWIDSKACFGDPDTMAKDFEQFMAYRRQVGEGLAIYWFGFVEDSSNADLQYSLKDWKSKHGIMVASSLPDTIVSRPDKAAKRPHCFTGRATTTSPMKSPN